MYSKIGLDQVLALVKEIYETSADASLQISIRTGCNWGRPSGGSIHFEHYKDIQDRKERPSTGGSPNPDFSAAWMGNEFRALCRKHGIEPEVYDDVC